MTVFSPQQDAALLAVSRWLKAWLPTWAIAFPALLVVRPFVQKLTERLIAQY